MSGLIILAGAATEFVALLFCASWVMRPLARAHIPDVDLSFWNPLWPVLQDRMQHLDPFRDFISRTRGNPAGERPYGPQDSP